MHPETTLRAGERYSRAHTVDPGPLQADAQIIERGVDPAKIRMNRSEGHTRARSRSQPESSQKPATLPRQRESALRDRRGEQAPSTLPEPAGTATGSQPMQSTSDICAGDFGK